MNPDIYKHLIILVLDEDPSKRILAARTLSAVGENAKYALPAFLLCHRTVDPRLAQYADYRKAVLTAIAQIAPADERAVGAVLEAIQYRRVSPHPADSQVRSAALKLAPGMQVREDRLVTAYLSALQDPSCCAEAVRQLGNLRGKAKAAVPALRLLKTHPKEDVRDEADRALRMIEN